MSDAIVQLRNKVIAFKYNLTDSFFKTIVILRTVIKFVPHTAIPSLSQNNSRKNDKWPWGRGRCGMATSWGTAIRRKWANKNKYEWYQVVAPHFRHFNIKYCRPPARRRLQGCVRDWMRPLKHISKLWIQRVTPADRNFTRFASFRFERSRYKSSPTLYRVSFPTRGRF